MSTQVVPDIKISSYQYRLGLCVHGYACPPHFGLNTITIGLNDTLITIALASAAVDLHRYVRHLRLHSYFVNKEDVFPLHTGKSQMLLCPSQTDLLISCRKNNRFTIGSLAREYWILIRMLL